MYNPFNNGCYKALSKIWSYEYSSYVSTKLSAMFFVVENLTSMCVCMHAYRVYMSKPSVYIFCNILDYERSFKMLSNTLCIFPVSDV